MLIDVRRGDEFLVAHRSPESGGYWHTIAGGVEDGETFAEAALRELREETGLEADASSRSTALPFATTGADPGLRVHVTRSSSTRRPAGSRRSTGARRVPLAAARGGGRAPLLARARAQLLRALP